MRLAGAVVLAMPLAAPAIAAAAAVAAQDDAARFDAILAARDASASLAGPDSGELVQDDGFMFRASPAGTMRVAVDSDGNWFFAVGAASPTAVGSVSGLVTEAGGANTLDLIVAHQTAVLGVNGEFAAVMDLPADSSGADVADVAAFFTDQTFPERVTPFRDFAVLPFDPDAVSVAEPTPTVEDEFASLLAETAQVTPLAGPFAGRLVESSPGTAPLAPAGVTLADFGAVATFVTPEDVSDGLWDAGIQFRSDADVTHRLILGFNGEVYAALPGESPRIVGTATTIDATPGAANARQLFVEDGRALVGVNGEFVAAIDLGHEPVAADVQAAAAFFDEDFVRDRVTAYEDFQVWEIA